MDSLREVVTGRSWGGRAPLPRMKALWILAFLLILPSLGLAAPRAFAGTAEEINLLPTLDSLNRSEEVLSNGSKWSALAWDSSTTGHNTGRDTAEGWGPYDAFATVNGAYWNPSTFSDKTGDAAAVTMQTSPGGAERYVALWLNMATPGSAKTGYQLRWTVVSGTTYNVTLSKYSAGTQTVLAFNSAVTIPNGATLAISDTGATVAAWQGSGGSLASILSASDATLTGGYAGFEGSGNISRSINFKAGNLSSTPPVPPDTTISSGPKGIVVPNLSFGFTSTEGGSSFECALDAGAFTACTSPKAYQGIAEGTHAFKARATGVGGKDETPAERSFQVVQAAKATTKTALLDNLERSEVPLATGKWSKSTWAGEIGGAWMGTYRGYGSGSGLAGAYWNPTTFSDGEGTVLVSGTVGTGSVPSGQYSALLLNMPSPSSARSGYEARFTGTGSATNYTVELAKWVSGARTVLASTTGFSLPVGTTMALTETAGGSLALWTGTTNLSAVLSASDSTYIAGYAGLEVNGGAGTVYNFRAGRIDIEPPDTTIQSGPSGMVPQKPVSFTFTASESSSSFECSLDGGAYGACSSPKEYSSLAGGSHTFRVRAVDAVGNVDGTPAERSFQIAKPPTVSTEAASGVKASGATLRAGVNPESQATTYQFEYGATAAYGSKVPASAKAIGSGAQVVEVSEAITGLQVGTTYHFRIVATNGTGTSQGQDRTFTTPATPVVASETATGVSAKEATLHASVNARGAATTYQFEYGTTTSYGSKAPPTPKAAGSDTAPIEVSQVIEGLSQGTTYHYRVVAENEVGSVHGEDLTLKTPLLPEAETEVPGAIEANEAVLEGSVDPNGSETEYQFEYGTTASYGSVVAANEAGNGTEAIEASESVGYLKPETTYHYRLAAKSSAGVDFGEDKTLKTDAAVMTPGEEAKLESEELAYTGALDGGSLPGNFFGVHWTGDFGQMAESPVMNAIKHSGSKFLRIVVAPGETSTNEKIFRQASNRGITIIPYIGSGEWWTAQETHRCQKKDPQTQQCVQADPLTEKQEREIWMTYARTVVEKYGPGGSFWSGDPHAHPVRVWELWNEPNLGSNSPSRNGSRKPFQEINAPGFGEFFDEMAKAAKAGAANRGQSIEIMTPALFSFASSDCREGGDCHLSPADFLGQMGHQSDYNTVSLHPYVFKVGENLHTPDGQARPEDIRKVKEKVRSYIADVRNKLENLGEGGKDIWVTELGFPVANQAGNTNAFPPVSEQTQKEEIEATFGMMKARHAELGIAHAIYFNIQDYRCSQVSVERGICSPAGKESPAWDGHSGLRRAQGGNRPGWRGFAGLTPTGEPNWPPKKKGKNVQPAPHPNRLMLTYGLETQGEKFEARAEYGGGALSSSYPNATEWQVIQPPEEGEAQGEVLEVQASTTIAGLQPETTYHYRIATKNENGEIEQTSGQESKTPPSTETSASVKQTLNGEPGWVSVGGYVHEGGEGIGLTNLYVNVNFEKWEGGQWVYKNTVEPHPVTNSGAYYEAQNWVVGKGLWRTRTVLPPQAGYGESASTYHEFTIKTGYQLVAKHSGKCLDVNGANTANGTTLLQWECGNPATQQNQVFTLKPMGGGYLELIARHAGRCVEVQGSSQSAGAVIQQWDCLGSGQASQLWQGVEVEPNGPENSYVNFIAKHSGQCMDVQGSGTANGTPVLQYSCGNHQANQMWTFKSVESNDIATHTYITLGEGLNGHPGYQSISGNVDTGAYPAAGKYVNVNFEKEVSPGNYQYVDTIEPHPTLDGSGHYSYNYWGVGAGNWRVRTVFPGEGALAASESEYHYFHIGDGYRFKFRHSGRCLTTSGGGTTNGTQIIQWDCSPSPNPGDGQIYSVVPVGGGYWEIRPDSNTGMCLDVAGASTANGAYLDLYQCIGAANQHWNIVPISGQPPWFASIAQHSGRCMNVEGSQTGNGARFLQWDCVWSGNEQWEWQSIG